MISLRTYLIVIEDVFACLRFLFLSVADGLFDEFLSAETKIEVLNNNTNELELNKILRCTVLCCNSFLYELGFCEFEL